MVIYVDEDDVDSHRFESNNFRLQLIIGTKLTMGGYNTACYEQATGDIIVLANDDIIINTKGWDNIVRAVDAEFEDGIYLSYPNDLFKKSRFCTFPILSRKTCELLVDPFPREYRRAFIDTHIFDIFKRVQHAGFNRIRYLKELEFEHLHYRNGKATYDETYKIASDLRFSDDPVFLKLTTHRSDAAKKLINEISGKRSLAIFNRTLHHQYPASIFSAACCFFSAFIINSDSPYMWRFFLWYWFFGRYLAANGFLNIFLRSTNKDEI